MTEPKREDDMDLITLKQAHRDHDIPLSTLSYWVREGYLTAQENISELGVRFYKVLRLDVKTLKANPPTRGRPRHRDITDG